MPKIKLTHRGIEALKAGTWLTDLLGRGATRLRGPSPPQREEELHPALQAARLETADDVGLLPRPESGRSP